MITDTQSGTTIHEIEDGIYRISVPVPEADFAYNQFLVMDDALRRAVMRHAGMGELEALARQAGMRTMYEDGIAKALAGLTTIEEVLRVTEDA